MMSSMGALLATRCVQNPQLLRKTTVCLVGIPLLGACASEGISHSCAGLHLTTAIGEQYCDMTLGSFK